MKIKLPITILFFLSCLLAQTIHAQTDSLLKSQNSQADVRPTTSDTNTAQPYIYPKPKNFAFVTNVPDNLWQLTKSPFQKNNLLPLSAVSVSSALLIWKDQEALEWVQRAADNINMNPHTSYIIALKVGQTKVLKLPRNLTAAFYQLGQGGTSMLVAGGLYAFGKINHNNRSLQTASDLAETFITMGLTTQILKRATGRQSPFLATRRGGRWQPFPSFSDFQQNTSNYDAFPSGHLATLMATVTVLSKNYPEKKWIKPVGYTLMSILSFTMMDIGVHWAGDYPLALAIGYVSGSITVNRHKSHQLKHVDL